MKKMKSELERLDRSVFDPFRMPFFREFWPVRALQDFSLNVPSADVEELDGKTVVSVDLPGFKAEEIDLTVENGFLTVKAESKMEDKGENRERMVWRSVERSWNLGSTIKSDSVNAELKDGVLKITLEKLDIPEKKKIEISATS